MQMLTLVLFSKSNWPNPNFTHHFLLSSSTIAVRHSHLWPYTSETNKHIRTRTQTATRLQCLPACKSANYTIMHPGAHDTAYWDWLGLNTICMICTCVLVYLLETCTITIFVSNYTNGENCNLQFFSPIIQNRRKGYTCLYQAMMLYVCILTSDLSPPPCILYS